MSKHVVASRKPLEEPPFSFNRAHPYMAELIDGLTQYDLTNGWVVSVRRSAFGWEAWAWPTGEDHRRALTPYPVAFDTEQEALDYRDGLAEKPGPGGVA